MHPVDPIVGKSFVIHFGNVSAPLPRVVWRFSKRY
jgi:hypothetical protein